MSDRGDLYMFNGDTVKKLAEMWRWYQRSYRNPPPPRYSNNPTPQIRQTWIGILQGALAYGSSADAKLYIWDGSAFTASDTIVTCYPWMMRTGDAIATNMEVVGGRINAKYVVFNAACVTGYGS